ncbi:MAG: tetratricopeptide repeat protein [Bacteroidia bacterium]|nr:tetratricopeptide repeat protein [Bacteroidia bacterium]
MGEVHYNNKPVKGAKVNIYFNNKLIHFTKVNDAGFIIKLELDAEYIYEIIAEGFLSPKYSISTKMPAEAAAKPIPPFDMGTITLIKDSPGIDKSAFIKPVAKILFNNAKGEFEYDKEYELLVAKELNKLKTQCEQNTGNQNIPTADDKNKEYKALLKEGDNLFNEKNYPNAKEKYQKAIVIQPDSQYPKNKISEIDKLLTSKDITSDIQPDIKPDEPEQSTDVKAATEKRDEKTLDECLAELKQIKAKGDNMAISDALYNVGKKYLENNDLENAKNNMEQALVLKKQTGDKKGMSELLKDIAIIDFDSGEFENSLENYDKAAKLKAEAGDNEGAANILNDMGLIAADLYRYDKALQNFKQALTAMESVDNKPALTGLLNNIGSIYFEKGDYNNALNYFKKSLEIDEELGNKGNIASLYNNMGIVYQNNGDFNNAVKSYEKSIEENEKLGNKKEISISLNNLGNVSYDWNKFKQALEYYHKSLQIKEAMDYKKGMALTFHNIGNVHKVLKEYNDALGYYGKSVELSKELEMNDLLQRNYESMSKVYYSLNDCKNAYEYYRLFRESGVSMPATGKSEQLSEFQMQTRKISQEKSMIIAGLKDEIEKQKILMKFQAHSKQLEIELKNEELAENEHRAKIQRNIIYGLIVGFLFFLLLALLLYKENRQKKAANKILVSQKTEIQKQAEQLIIVNKALDKLSIVARETDNSVIIARPDGEIEWVNEGFTRLLGYTLDEFKEKFGSNLFITSSNPKLKEIITECIENKKSAEYLSEINIKSGERLWLQTTITPVFDKNGNVVELVAIDSNITKVKQAEEEIKQQQKDLVKAFKHSSRQQTELHRAMLQIEAQKNEITDSIQYASRIQAAIFPPVKIFDEYFTEYFILNKPRDIVSGDFYWCSKFRDKIFIAIADCTGHGVPGAFMSLLGVTFLNEILINYEKQDKYDIGANELLNDLRKHVILSLRQTSEFGSTKDGMDIALVIIDRKEMKLHFSGANNPLYIITPDPQGLRNKVSSAGAGNTADSGDLAGQALLKEIKGDKMPIGIHTLATVPFTNRECTFSRGDTIYLFSDGFIDQFGGPDKKKFKSKYFRELLLKLKNLTMKEQKQALEHTLNEWQGETEQVDDILVMGIRL